MTKKTDRRQRLVRRSLGMESLETRRFLAGDADSFLMRDAGRQDPIGDAAFVVASTLTIPAVNTALNTALNAETREAPPPVAVSAISALSANDTVVRIGSLKGIRQLSGRLTPQDRSDAVQFTIDRAASVKLNLTALQRDANLYLFDERGNLQGHSEKRGRSAEAIHATLDAGIYYVVVMAAAVGVSPYRLSLSATWLPQPIPQSPPALDPFSPPLRSETPAEAPTVIDPPVSDSPDPNPLVEPLADVAYYGGARDWNLNAIGAPEAWAAGYTGNGVLVAIVDTGVQLNHPDLVRNLFVNPGEIPGNAIDDDRNGFVDDVHGFDFVDRDGRPDDLNGHGTHVAGIVAAVRNSVGGTGVAPDAKLLPVRVLDKNGAGSDSSVAAGIRYAAQLGAKVINLSLGGAFSQVIAHAIDFAHSLGSFVVAASGNESAAVPGYPGRFSATDANVISVGAYNSSGGIGEFSNAVGGSGAVQVDAPGVGIYSTYLRGRYAMLSGTSMAAPHVAGLAALTLSANPMLTSPELRALLATGTVGRAAGSDSIGSANAATTVAYALAGLKSMPSQTGALTQASTPARSQLRDFQVRATPVDQLFSRPDPFPNPWIEDASTTVRELERVLSVRYQQAAKPAWTASLLPGQTLDALVAVDKNHRSSDEVNEPADDVKLAIEQRTAQSLPRFIVAS